MTENTMEMRQRTVGSVTYNGVKYDIDWMYRTDEKGTVVECEDGAFVFVGDEQITDFVNPNWDERGWKSVDHLMMHAREFILSGDMHQKVRDADKIVAELKEIMGWKSKE